MKIGKYTLRKPWTTEVEIDLGAEIYDAVRKSIGEDIAKEIEDIDSVPIAKTLFERGLHFDGASWAAMMRANAAAISRGQK